MLHIWWQRCRNITAKITTHFDKMDYMPVYPVYSWVPVKNADHYKIDVFYVPKYDFNNIEK